MRLTLLILALGLAAPATARAACQSSAGGASSYARRLSPRAGLRCLHLVSVYEGPVCAGPARWTVEASCSETRRLAVSERGRLISILAPRASNPSWPFVRVFWREGEELRVGSIPLSEVSSARRPRISFEGAALRFEGSADVPFAQVEALAEAHARRRRRWL